MSLAHHRPRSAAEILDASAQIYRAHLGTLVLISVAVVLPPLLLRALMPPIIDLFLQLIGNLLLPVAGGATILFVTSLLEEGREISAADAYRRLGKRAGELIGVGLMSGILVVLGFILLIIPGFIALAWTAVAAPVVAIEGVTGSAAISRSRALARGLMKHVLGTMVLAWIIVFGIMIGASVLTGLMGGVIGVQVSDLIGEALLVLLLPLLTIPTVLLYYDLRIRNEGADIDAMIGDLPSDAVPVQP